MVETITLPSRADDPPRLGKWEGLQPGVGQHFRQKIPKVVIQEHWNANVIILMKFLSLTALEVVKKKMTTSSAASDEIFVKMTTYPFQWGCMAQDTLV